MHEYLLAGLATRDPDGAARAPLAILWFADLSSAIAFGQTWLIDQAPPTEGWAGHALRVERLENLRAPAPRSF
jgi:hypothetical protein